MASYAPGQIYNALVGQGIPPQDARTLFGGPGAPRPKGRVGKLDRAPGFGRSHIGNMPNHGAGRWIIDRDGAAAVGGYPLARDQASVTQ